MIGEALKSNCALIELNISCNEIGDVGTEELSEALKTNSTLTILKLYCTGQNNTTM